MHIGKGRIDEILTGGQRSALISCPPGLVPAPGRYLLAHADADSTAPLPHPVFSAGAAPSGFYAAPPTPASWLPGTTLCLQGPFGRGFNLPPVARRVVLVALADTFSRLWPLLELSFTQNAEVAILAESIPENLSPAVEILPLSALSEAAAWADYLALGLPRSQLGRYLEKHRPSLLSASMAELFIETPLPCGSLAECGVCSIPLRHGYALACKDGPVFPLSEL